MPVVEVKGQKSGPISVETVESLIQARDFLLANGFSAEHEAIKALDAKIERGNTLQRAWIAKVEEIAAIINGKVRRVRSKEDAEKSYDAGKLLYELSTIRQLIDARIADAAEYNVQ